MPTRPRTDEQPSTRVNASLTSVTLASSNETRIGLSIENDTTTGYLDIKFGVGASASDRLLRMAPGDFYELPVYADGSVYGGVITGVWTVADGAANVVEV